LALDSTGAAALRVRFTDFHAGSGKVWLLGDTGGDPITVGPYTQDGPFGDGEFWTDMIEGESVVIAYEAGAEEPPTDTVPFRVPEISHRVMPASRKSVASAETYQPLAAAASCAIDVTCHAEYNEPASAVALMVFESGGRSYECSGALTNSASQPARPFFLTANHCIGTAAEARSLVAFFGYQTPSCGAEPPPLNRVPRVTGASFIAGEPMSRGDFSLLELSAFPNVDVKVLGWLTSEIGAGESVVGISHPLGDYKRIAFGNRTRDLTIRFNTGERMPASVGYQVAWLQGVTQSGSSGSPLLVRVDGKEYVAGTLSAGPAIDDDNSTQVCRTRNMVASYGRFSVAYPRLAGALGSPSGPPNVTQPSITASPNPLRFAAGRALGAVTITWQANTAAVQIRVNSPNGPPLTGIELARGSAQTGDWVADGTTFYLQDASDGHSLGAARTLATVRVQAVSP
jgi:hypothetical protein